jgi:pimeloyl-ACP methyl ester carboxylesterase
MPLPFINRICRYFIYGALPIIFITGCKRNLSTIPKNNNNIIGQTVNTVINGQSARIAYKPSKDNKPRILIIYFHGNTESQNEAFTDYREKYLTDSLIYLGCVVASSNAGGSLWGNQFAQDCYYNLYKYAIAHFNINKTVFIGQSMGGLTSLNLIASHRIPVNSWVGIYPVTNLNMAYFKEGFASNLESSYHFHGKDNYASATNNFDPNLKDKSLYEGVKYYITASNDDTVVPKALNADLFHNKLGTTINNILLVTQGNHGDDSNFLPHLVYKFLVDK